MPRPVPIIAPSILASDFARLGEEARAVEAAGADWLHVDVMDGHFVPNITIGPDVVKALRPHVSIPMDVHLMISPVDPYLEAFRDAGADLITIHPEAGPHLNRSLRHIRQLGAKAGVAFDPSTPPETIEWMLDDVDLVLVMTINPGFGGQSFMPSQLDKIARLRAMIDASGRDIVLEVDGGVAPGTTAPRCLEAGATALVAGTAVFRGGPDAYAANIRALKGL
ncbi:MAG TPA: ribulose-phosphate 3-epimerase [Caulobacteraceae bacterium]|jgi:ribulose-phosphate 3-epimerase|nr:ribulose-phosphate 3-epimerase [Caulobacteraceae bacterium]